MKYAYFILFSAFLSVYAETETRTQCLARCKGPRAECDAAARPLLGGAVEEDGSYSVVYECQVSNVKKTREDCEAAFQIAIDHFCRESVTYEADCTALCPPEPSPTPTLVATESPTPTPSPSESPTAVATIIVIPTATPTRNPLKDPPEPEVLVPPAAEAIVEPVPTVQGDGPPPASTTDAPFVASTPTVAPEPALAGTPAAAPEATAAIQDTSVASTPAPVPESAPISTPAPAVSPASTPAPEVIPAAVADAPVSTPIAQASPLSSPAPAASMQVP